MMFPKHLHRIISFHFLTFRRTSVVALRRNSKKLISIIMLRKQKIKCKGFVMYYASVKIWILIEMLVPDSHKLLREPGYAPHMSVSLCFTLHMFHTFHTLTLLANVTDQKQHLSSPRPNGRKVQKGHYLTNSTLWSQPYLLTSENMLFILWASHMQT